MVCGVPDEMPCLIPIPQTGRNRVILCFSNLFAGARMIKRLSRRACLLCWKWWLLLLPDASHCQQLSPRGAERNETVSGMTNSMQQLITTKPHAILFRRVMGYWKREQGWRTLLWHWDAEVSSSAEGSLNTFVNVGEGSQFSHVPLMSVKLQSYRHTWTYTLNEATVVSFCLSSQLQK